MTQTEVLGVEIRRYVDATGEHRALVHRLIGQTEAASDTQARPGRAVARRTGDQASWVRRLLGRASARVDIPDERLDKRPGFAGATLAADAAFAQVIATVDWAIEQFKNASAAG